MGRKPTNNREKLIETALELIWLESYNAVSVDDICKKAGVQKGSFYHYFPSKAHLALETMDDCVQQHIAEYEEMFSADTPPPCAMSGRPPPPLPPSSATGPCMWMSICNSGL